MDDINIIVKQTGLSKEEVLEIYNNYGKNIVDTICHIEGITESKEKKKKLTPVQEKIKELRDIVDEKDALMDLKILKNKV